MASNVEWQFDRPDWAERLARCGKWMAEVGWTPYSEGLVIIRYTGDAPDFWGQGDGPAPSWRQKKTFPESQNAIELIDELSQQMVRGLNCSLPCNCCCQLVYVASLNEGPFERAQLQESFLKEGEFKKVRKGPAFETGIHFWLLPRYQHDEAFLKTINEDGTDNDGFALMAEWRKQFLRRKKTNNWGDWPIPRDVSYNCWFKYVQEIRRQLESVWRDTSKTA